jgi:uncharacterized protein (DUF1697 family)
VENPEMSAYVSMLRGINVGGQKKIRMETLCELYEKLGFTRVRTYVQSGNVVFESSVQGSSDFGRRIEAQIEQTCGYCVPVFIRQAEELQRILAGNPFINERNENPSKLYVTFLYLSPPKTTFSNLVPPGNSVDEFSPGETEIYLYCPNGYGTTKLSNNFFERKLEMPCTTRNWNTVNTLFRMLSE